MTDALGGGAATFHYRSRSRRRQATCSSSRKKNKKTADRVFFPCCLSLLVHLQLLRLNPEAAARFLAPGAVRFHHPLCTHVDAHFIQVNPPRPPPPHSTPRLSITSSRVFLLAPLLPDTNPALKIPFKSTVCRLCFTGRLCYCVITHKQSLPPSLSLSFSPPPNSTLLPPLLCSGSRATD